MAKILDIPLVTKRQMWVRPLKSSRLASATTPQQPQLHEHRAALLSFNNGKHSVTLMWRGRWVRGGGHVSRLTENIQNVQSVSGSGKKKIPFFIFSVNKIKRFVLAERFLELSRCFCTSGAMEALPLHGTALSVLFLARVWILGLIPGRVNHRGAGDEDKEEEQNGLKTSSYLKKAHRRERPWRGERLCLLSEVGSMYFSEKEVMRRDKWRVDRAHHINAGEALMATGCYSSLFVWKSREFIGKKNQLWSKVTCKKCKNRNMVLQSKDMLKM